MSADPVHHARPGIPARKPALAALLLCLYALDFLRHADSILTAKVKSAILSQTYTSLFANANANGVMIGDGEVWFSGICKDASCADPPIKITAINP